MYVCVENLNHSLCVTVVMQVVDLAQESLKQLKMALLHFVDASEVLTQPENVMVHIVLSKMINGKKISRRLYDNYWYACYVAIQLHIRNKRH